MFGYSLQSDTGVHIHWKGAAELVLSSCKSWLSLDGSVQPMGAQKVTAMHNLPPAQFLMQSYNVDMFAA